jgi:bla regulator protein blaR1
MISRYACVILLAAPLFAQAPLKFEVATIKPSAPGPSVVRPTRTGGGRIAAQGITLKNLIYFAYSSGLGTAFNVSGGPDWVGKDRFDILAQAPGSPTDREFRNMFRALLAERFGLTFHTETKQIDVYALTVDRADGKLGPRVHPWDGTCEGRAPTEEDPTVPRCGGFFRPPGMFLEGVTMFSAAEMLSLPQPNLGRIVQDHTGLTGLYKMDLEFTFTRTPDPSGPSIFTAIKEQWGLKLEPSKGPLEMLIVDSAHPPTEN